VRKTDEEFERATGIRPADHNFVTPATIKKAERQMLGPLWGKRRRPYKPR
jgi:hypothetical protein